jgi:hypothetical protein
MIEQTRVAWRVHYSRKGKRGVDSPFLVYARTADEARAVFLSERRGWVVKPVVTQVTRHRRAGH